MGDSAALRQKRWRNHRAGIHDLCRPGCQDRSAPVSEPAPGEPPGLGERSSAFRQALLGDYELGEGELVILDRICRLLDRLERLDYFIARSQPLIKGSRDNFRPNPLWKEARECEKALDLLVRSLALPLPGETEGVWRSPEQRQRAQLRWRKFYDEKDRARGTLAS